MRSSPSAGLPGQPPGGPRLGQQVGAAVGPEGRPQPPGRQRDEQRHPVGHLHQGMAVEAGPVAERGERLRDRGRRRAERCANSGTHASMVSQAEVAAPGGFHLARARRRGRRSRLVAAVTWWRRPGRAAHDVTCALAWAGSGWPAGSATAGRGRQGPTSRSRRPETRGGEARRSNGTQRCRADHRGPRRRHQRLRGALPPSRRRGHGRRPAPRPDPQRRRRGRRLGGLRPGAVRAPAGRRPGDGLPPVPAHERPQRLLRPDPEGQAARRDRRGARGPRAGSWPRPPRRRTTSSGSWRPRPSPPCPSAGSSCCGTPRSRAGRPAEVGPLLGLAPNAVAALAYRAREGLRQAYLNAHIQARPPAECADTVPKLGAYVRDDLSNRDRQKVEEHLERLRALPGHRGRAPGGRVPAAHRPHPDHGRHPGRRLPVRDRGRRQRAGSSAGAAAWGGASRRRALPARRPRRSAAVAAAGLLIVGSVAVAQSLSGNGGREQVAASAPGDGSGGGSGGDQPGGDGGSAGDAAIVEAPVASDAPESTDDPSATDETSATDDYAVEPIRASSTTRSPTSLRPTSPRRTSPRTPWPTSPRTPSPRTRRPTRRPTRPRHRPRLPPHLPPRHRPAFSVSLGSPGPAYAGLGVAIPATIGNGVAAGSTSAVAAAPRSGAGLGFGRSAVRSVLPRQAGSASQPTLTITLPAGVTYDSVDNPAWSCAVAGTSLQCVLPPLAPGVASAGLVQLAIAPNAPSPITLEPSVVGRSRTSGDGPSARDRRPARAGRRVRPVRRPCRPGAPGQRHPHVQPGGRDRLRRPLGTIPAPRSGRSTRRASR